jgi:hypothetical protein
MVAKMPEEESISRKDYFVHTMYKVKSSEAIRQAKQFDTEMGNQSCLYQSVIGKDKIG